MDTSVSKILKGFRKITSNPVYSIDGRVYQMSFRYFVLIVISWIQRITNNVPASEALHLALIPEPKSQDAKSRV
jgi:hypothetical protein